MNWNAKLYLVLDAQVNDYDQLFDIFKKAADSQVDVIQLRDKNGTCRDVVEFSKRAIKYLNRQIPFIVNDRVDVALAVGADGVHLGQDDLALRDARAILGDKMMIGVSCQTLEQARQAQEQGADYIGFGSVFKTLTKPQRDEMNMNLLTRVFSEITIPVFAIGGINLSNVSMLIEKGVDRVAVTRAISLADDIAGVTKEFLAKLNGGKEIVRG